MDDNEFTETGAKTGIDWAGEFHKYKKLLVQARRKKWRHELFKLLNESVLPDRRRSEPSDQNMVVDEEFEEESKALLAEESESDEEENSDDDDDNNNNDGA